MTTVERPPVLDRLHDVLVVVLIALRPLCWDGAAGQPADLLWQGLATGACLIAAIERAAGLRGGWVCGWRGLLAILLLATLLPGILGSPEPAPAWCFWSGLAASLAAAAYLAQVLVGRVSLAWAALAGGLAATAVLGVTQPLLVLPAMAAAQNAGAGVFDALPGDAAAVAERIANGGAFATFTLANQFGAYLALCVPLVAGIAWSSRGVARWVAAAITVLGLAALAATGAKGAWLALAAGGGLGWFIAWRGRWWRWLPLPLALAACLVLALSGRAASSIDVRLGYWRSAAALVAEAPLAGQGHLAFAAHQPRLMRPGDEPTRFVHNEALEVAVSSGIPAALLLLACLVALAWPRRRDEALVPDAPRPLRAVPWILAGMIPYLGLLGAFDGNLGWWPGGGTMDAVLGWAVLLGLVAAAVAWALLRASPPPVWAAVAGLSAVAMKSCIDFDLHAMGVLATAAFVAVLAWHPGRASVSAAGRWLPLAGAAILLVVVSSGISTGLRLAEADTLIADARQVRDEAGARILAHRLDADPITPAPVLAGMAGLRAWELAAGAPATRLACLELIPVAPQSVDMAEELALQAPHSAAAALRHAAALVAARRWAEAADEAERAAGLSPSAPRVLAGSAGVLERVAEALPGRSELRARAVALRAEALRLQPLVHPAMRTRD